MILIIDNYDSFTYNIAQYLQSIGAEVLVRRNDEITIEDIRRLSPDALVMSPGPGGPESAGICIDVVRSFAERIPLLGVCLGHQAIAAAFGGRITRARSIMHGKTSMISHDGAGLFRGIRSPFRATRYHSLVVEEESLPGCLSISARSEDGEIMGLRHKDYPVEGLQFHPESILTEEGLRIMGNFLERR